MSECECGVWSVECECEPFYILYTDGEMDALIAKCIHGHSCLVHCTLRVYGGRVSLCIHPRGVVVPVVSVALVDSPVGTVYVLIQLFQYQVYWFLQVMEIIIQHALHSNACLLHAHASIHVIYAKHEPENAKDTQPKPSATLSLDRT